MGWSGAGTHTPIGQLQQHVRGLALGCALPSQQPRCACIMYHDAHLASADACHTQPNTAAGAVLTLLGSVC